MTKNLTRHQTPKRQPTSSHIRFDRDMTDSMSALRAFAHSLSRNPDQADDLVQETCLKALSKRSQFVAGTNQRAWMFQILKNTFLSQIRRTRREAPAEEAPEPRAAYGIDGPEAYLRLREVEGVIESLPRAQREAIILVGAEVRSYEEAAEICDCAIGTVKSRVSRARERLMADFH